MSGKGSVGAEAVELEDGDGGGFPGAVFVAGPVDAEPSADGEVVLLVADLDPDADLRAGDVGAVDDGLHGADGVLADWVLRADLLIDRVQHIIAPVRRYCRFANSPR